MLDGRTDGRQDGWCSGRDDGRLVLTACVMRCVRRVCSAAVACVMRCLLNWQGRVQVLGDMNVIKRELDRFRSCAPSSPGAMTLLRWRSAH